MLPKNGPALGGVLGWEPPGEMASDPRPVPPKPDLCTQLFV